MAEMLYADGADAVERYDHVEVYLPGPGGRDLNLYDGRVSRLHPRRRELGVLIEDFKQTTREGEPRRRLVRVPIADVTFLRRDG